MSRNLGRTDCNFCDGEVVMEETPREATSSDMREHFLEINDGYSHRGMIVAKAHCFVCNAKYLAHVDMSACPGYRNVPQLRNDDRTKFIDLSFRSTFDDEPGEDDLPDYKIEYVPTRTPWPVCGDCGKKKYECYGCECERKS